MVHDICGFTLDFATQGKYNLFWVYDQSYLEKRENWKRRDFHPGKALRCEGYSSTSLRKGIKNQDQKIGKKFLSLIKKHMPKDIYQNILDEGNRQEPYDFYNEWNLSKEQ